MGVNAHINSFFNYHNIAPSSSSSGILQIRNLEHQSGFNSSLILCPGESFLIKLEAFLCVQQTENGNGFWAIEEHWAPSNVVTPVLQTRAKIVSPIPMVVGATSWGFHELSRSLFHHELCDLHLEWRRQLRDSDLKPDQPDHWAKERKNKSLREWVEWPC